MLEAAAWGFAGGASLILGAVAGLLFHTPKRVIGAIMGFGAGVLVSAVAFELTAEAFDGGGKDATALGLAGGALAFFGANRLVARRGGDMRKRSRGQPSEGSANALIIGALLDGIPESIAIGLTLIGGGDVGLAVVAAVFLSNVPESLSAATGMRAAGRSTVYILGLWTLVALASAVAAAVGFGLLGGASGDVVAVIQAFAAGAILTMLADTMFPEAYEDAGSAVGLFTVLGFTLAFFLSTLE